MIDGTGNPWFLADVALDGDRIAAIGDLRAATAGREIDATGLYVTPGFIDAHSHAGPGLATAGLSHAEPLLAQGLTTVVINPDGGGPVDLARQRSELLRDGLGVNTEKNRYYRIRWQGAERWAEAVEPESEDLHPVDDQLRAGIGL